LILSDRAPFPSSSPGLGGCQEGVLTESVGLSVGFAKIFAWTSEGGSAVPTTSCSMVEFPEVGTSNWCF